MDTADVPSGADALAPDPVAPPNGPRPYWLPARITWEDWPPELRAAYNAIIAPLHEELVTKAPTSLARSTGATICFLCLQEIIHQLQLGRELDGADPLASSESASRHAEIDRLLRLAGAKLKHSAFFQRLTEFQAAQRRERCGREADALDARAAADPIPPKKGSANGKSRTR